MRLRCTSKDFRALFVGFGFILQEVVQAKQALDALARRRRGYPEFFSDGNGNGKGHANGTSNGQVNGINGMATPPLLEPGA